MNKDVLNSLFTRESLLSLQGAALVTLLVPNVLAYLIGSSFAPYEKWVAFIIAMLLAFLIALQASDRSATKWILAVLNGFLIFASAVGLTQALSSSAGVGLGTSGATGERVPFFHSWYP